MTQKEIWIKAFGSKKYKKFTEQVLKDEDNPSLGIGIVVFSNEEARALCKFFHSFGLTWTTGEPYIISSNSKKTICRTKIGTSYPDYGKLAGKYKRVYYPYIGQIRKNKIKKTKVITYKEFLIKLHKYFYNEK